MTSATASTLPARRWPMALGQLLRRPAAAAWLLLATLASMAVIALVWVLYRAFDISYGEPETALSLSFCAVIGLLVGQSIKELQHCPFSWGLPHLRSGLFPGALIVGAFVALFNREIIVATVALLSPVFEFFTGRGFGPYDVWRSFPASSAGLVALSFLAFWIGVRPSIVNLVGVLGPLLLLSPVLPALVRGRAALVGLMCAPLLAFLLYDTFSVAAARRRPFLSTRPLSGAGWSHGRSRAEPRVLARPFATARWRFDTIGRSIRRWVLAGWYENHGWSGRRSLAAAFLVVAASYAILGAMVVTTIAGSRSLWFGAGYGRVRDLPSYVLSSIDSIIVSSVLIGVPFAITCLCYGSISLRRPALYPLSRRRLAAIEYRSSLWEAVFVTGFLTAILLGFWTLLFLIDFGVGAGRFVRWPLPVGGQNGWALALVRPIALVFIVAPVAQLYRLRHMRAPRPLGPVGQLLTVLALTAALTWAGVELALGSVYLGSRFPLVLHVAVFATVALISQYLYRHAVDRHFARADLM